MSRFRIFYGVMSVIFLFCFVEVQVLEHSKALEADREMRRQTLAGELAILELRTAPIKEGEQTRQKIEKLLERFKRTLGQDPAVMANLITAKGVFYDIDPMLIMAVIKTESDFRVRAVSHKGAVGLMQLRPFTARAVAGEIKISHDHAENLMDARLNIILGTHYLAKMIERFGNLDLALEAYNRGPSRLAKQMGSGQKIRLYYAKRVMRHYESMSRDSSRL